MKTVDKTVEYGLFTEYGKYVDIGRKVRDFVNEHCPYLQVTYCEDVGNACDYRFNDSIEYYTVVDDDVEENIVDYLTRVYG